MKCIEEVDNKFGLFIFHSRMAGNGKFLLVDLFRDRQRKVIPLNIITFLLMGRNGIMDLRLDTVVSEIALQFIATRAEDGENMINAVAIERKAVSR